MPLLSANTTASVCISSVTRGFGPCMSSPVTRSFTCDEGSSREVWPPSVNLTMPRIPVRSAVVVEMLLFLRASFYWLGSQTSALFAIIIVDSWQSIPFVMLLVLAALTAISPSLYEAARVDGASASQIFRRITLPLITPTLLVITMIKIMDFLKLFDTLFILTRGGPGNATTTLGLWTYKTGFVFLEFSRAAALGVIITIITLPVYFLWRRASRGVR